MVVYVKGASLYSSPITTSAQVAIAPNFYHNVIGSFYNIVVTPDSAEVVYSDNAYNIYSSPITVSMPNHIADAAEALIKRHMINYTPEWKDSTIRKFIKNNYAILDPLLSLYRADAGSLADPAKPLSMVEELVSRINQQQIEEISRLESPLDGNEIQGLLGIPPGPKIGEIKKAVVDAILEGTIEATKQAARDFILKSFPPSETRKS